MPCWSQCSFRSVGRALCRWDSVKHVTLVRVLLNINDTADYMKSCELLCGLEDYPAGGIASNTSHIFDDFMDMHDILHDVLHELLYNIIIYI